MKEMKDTKEPAKVERKVFRKVSTLKCYVGVHQFAGALTIEAEKHNADIEMYPTGIVVAKRKGKRDIAISPSNWTHAELLDE